MNQNHFLKSYFYECKITKFLNEANKKNIKYYQLAKEQSLNICYRLSVAIKFDL